MGMRRLFRSGDSWDAMRLIINVAIIYAAWFATVLAAAGGQPLTAAAFSIAAAAINVSMARKRLPECRLVLQVAAVGILFDSIVINFGLAKYASPGVIAQFPPLWMISLWMAFATTINVSLAWLQQRLPLASALAAIGGPLSYYAGARLGGMIFSEPLWLSIAAIAILWAAAFPLILWLARRIPPKDSHSRS